MCGIAGVLDADREARVDRDGLERAAKALHHRGPDDSAVWAEAGAGLAHTRLAIIDLEGGGQPMRSADGRSVVVFNGEIYNHRELRRDLEAAGRRFRTRSDTEVLLHLWDVLGPAMVERLRGMFAFALFDRRERRAILARDRFGKKPLCFAAAEGRLAFASTTDALLALLDRRPELDPQAIASYLTLQYVPAPLSVFAGVEKLPPGSVLEWRDGRHAVRRYWEPPERVARDDLDPREAAERVRSLVGDAVRARLESEVPLGAFLSGGLDSSVVVAEMAAAGPRPRTFSVGFRHAAFDETSYARLVAERFGTDHAELVPDADAGALFDAFVSAYDEPFADSSALATLAVTRSARDHVTVVLTGDGGDELFGGYERYLWFRRFGRIARRLGPAARPLAAAADATGRALRRPRISSAAAFVRSPWAGYRDRLFHFPPAEASALLEPDVRSDVDALAPVRALDALWRRSGGGASGLTWVDQWTYLPDDLLVKMDRATMAHGLEARSPLLDHVLAESVAGFDERTLFDARGGKAVLRRAYADVLPEPVLSRPKMGFGVPLAAWMRGELRPALNDLVLTSEGPLGGVVRPDAAAALVRRFLDGDDAVRWRTWNLLTLAGWASARGIR